MPDKHLVRMHFSANAGNYDLYAHVQKKMASTLMEFADPAEGDKPGAILDVGCETGHLTELLIRRFPHAHVTAVDIAPGMIDLAKRKFSGRGLKHQFGGGIIGARGGSRTPTRLGTGF